jgi:penicillin-binding protein 2
MIFFFEQLKQTDRRLQMVSGVVLAGMLILLGGLWHVQVVSSKRYQSDLQVQSVRTVRVPAIRGKILDRNHVPLAENRPSYNVNLYLEELRKNFRHEYTNNVRPGFVRANPEMKRPPRRITRELEKQARYQVVSNMLLAVSTTVHQPRALIEREFHRHYYEELSLPFPLLRDLSPEEVALFAEKSFYFPNMDLDVLPIRHYPQGASAAHLLGYLRRNNNPLEHEEFSFQFRLPDYEGVKGLELAFDSYLRGQAGVKLVQVNSMNYRESEEILVTAEPGQNVVLTLDLDIQKAAERALSSAGPATRGAAVVMDVRSGDILAMASAPSFDPNRFIAGFSQAEWAEMSDEQLTPLFNRAAYGLYPPGSIFKVMVALAALEAGLDPSQVFHYSRSYFRQGARIIRDPAGPGFYNFRKALSASSNQYFLEQGSAIGPERMVEMSRRFGLGRPTGLLSRQEARGYLPNSQQLRKRDGSRWMPGDSWNLSIGQGEILVTPLQMAVATAAIANGGRVLQPRLMMEIEDQHFPGANNSFRIPPGQVLDSARVQPRHLETLRTGMLAVVEDVEGTGRRAFLPGMRIAGKTGTAQVMHGSRLKEYITWFVSFAPYEAPRYAVVVVVEGGTAGGQTCAPLARDIYRALLDREKRAPGKGEQWVWSH